MYSWEGGGAGGMQGKGFVQREGAVKSPRIFMEVWYFLGFFCMDSCEGGRVQANGLVQEQGVLKTQR